MSTHFPLIAAHAVLLLALVIAATMENSHLSMNFQHASTESLWLWSVSIGLGVSQTAFLGTFASLAYTSVSYRVRLTYRLLLLQWICFSVPLLSMVKKRPMPWCLLFSEMALLIAAILVGLIVRWVTRRRLTFETKDTTRIQNVNSLMDLFVLIMLVAIFMGVTIRYNEDVSNHPLATLDNEIMIAISVIFGMPFSAILAVQAIGYGVRDPKFSWYWGRTWLACAVIVFFIYQLLMIQTEEQLYSDGELSVSTIFVSSMVSNVVSAMYFRYKGITLRRITDMPLPIAHLPEVEK